MYPAHRFFFSSPKPLSVLRSWQRRFASTPLQITTALDLDSGFCAIYSSDYYKVTIVGGKSPVGTIYYPDGSETLEAGLKLFDLPAFTKVYNKQGVLLSYSTPLAEVCD